jgi:hypothetical protein
MLSFPIRHRLAGFYFFYYSIVGTFMPFWSLYLEDQGFNYSEIGILSSIAIITRFFAPFIWGWIATNAGTNVLATPQILTMDNVEGAFESGEEVPTTETTSATNGSTTNSIKMQKVSCSK